MYSAIMTSKNLADFFIEKTANLRLTEVAKATGIGDSFLSKLRSGKYKSAGLEVAIDLALYFHEPLDKILKLIGKETYYDKMKRCLAKEFQKDPIIQLSVPSGEFDGVKCFADPVCLGPGFNMDEAQPVGYLPIHKSELPVGYKSEADRIVCFKTAGLSMVPTIMPDSHVIIDRYVPAEWIVPGGLYAFLLPNGDVTIKRLLNLTDDSAIIGADNPNEKGFPMVLKLQEDESVVRGRVLWIINRLVEKPKE